MLLVLALAGCESFAPYEPEPVRLLDLNARCSTEQGLNGVFGPVQPLNRPPEPMPPGASARWTAPDGSALAATSPGDPGVSVRGLRAHGPLAQGATYRLDLSAPSFPDASAECTLPLPAADLRADVLGPPGADGRLPVRVGFRDRPGANAYWLRVSAVADADTFRTGLRYSGSHPALNEASFWATVQAGSGPRDVPGILRDVLFDGETFSADLRVHVDPRRYGRVQFDALEVELVTMPRESFAYWAVRLGQIPQTPFGDPLPLPSNVAGGTGFLEAEVRQSVPLPQ